MPRALRGAGGAATLAATAIMLAAGAAPAQRSPMVESTRAHERLAPRDLPGVRLPIAGPAGRPAELFVPASARSAQRIDLVVHFHGAAFLPGEAVASCRRDAAVVVVNLGAGSGVYHRAFDDASAFDSLLAHVESALARDARSPVRIDRVVLSAFSAGHGAVRAILRDPRHFDRVDAILLLDGLHTSYVPEGVPLADGGVLDTTNLVALTAFARRAAMGSSRMLVTHSEIFPGTYASTTETADWMVRSLGATRVAVMRWGPRGMQQLSEARIGGWTLLGFAGNSAPDHIDHFHAMPELLARLLGPCDP